MSERIMSKEESIETLEAFRIELEDLIKKHDVVMLGQVKAGNTGATFALGTGPEYVLGEMTIDIMHFSSDYLKFDFFHAADSDGTDDANISFIDHLLNGHHEETTH